MQLEMMDQLMDQSLEEVENDPKQITNEMIVIRDGDGTPTTI